MGTTLATYEQKVAHVQVVAQRGAEARKMVEDAGQKPGRLKAHAVFKAMAAERQSAAAPYAKCLAFTDTPADRLSQGDALSPAWAKHVRRVFVSSFVAGKPKPLPPK
ncbi:hypothetical protein [Amycolatopsis sp. NPDC051903]|uniref:hypothetical protein n=1 Tax=Amycolatopsis sp. NPDC051903 TaxID=3363936 RepID=UPI0037AA2DF0